MCFCHDTTKMAAGGMLSASFSPDGNYGRDSFLFFCHCARESVNR